MKYAAEIKVSYEVMTPEQEQFYWAYLVDLFQRCADKVLAEEARLRQAQPAELRQAQPADQAQAVEEAHERSAAV